MIAERTFLALASLATCVLMGATPSCASESDTQSLTFHNDNVNRWIDLTKGAIVRERVQVEATALTSGASRYLIDLNSEEAADVKVFVGSSKEAAKIERASHSHYSVNLPEPLQEGDKLTLRAELAYVRRPLPYPEAIGQRERQSLRYQIPACWNPAMASKIQKTTFGLPTPEILQKSESLDSQASGSILTFDEYDCSRVIAPLWVHYVDPKSVAFFKEYKKTFQLSHWTENLAVDEGFEIHHAGASLKDNFSRVDYMSSQYIHHMTSVLKNMIFILPRFARDVYYRDVIGNVSSSNFRREVRQSVLDIRPRYPLYGGWRYTWNHGYNVRSGPYLRKKEGSDEYVARLPFLGGFQNISIVDMELKIILPEGAESISIQDGGHFDSIVESNTKTYLDYNGHPTFILSKRHVVDEHDGFIYVQYRLPTSGMLLKPLVVSTVVAILFVIASLYSRLDLSIRKKAKKKLQ